MTIPAVVPRRGRPRVFVLISIGLLLTYVIAAVVAWPRRGVDDNGPLRESAADVRTDVRGAAGLAEVRKACLGASSVTNGDPAQKIGVVSGVVQGQRLFGCYGYSRSDPDRVYGAAVLDARARQVKDTDLIQASGAWRYIGLVKTPLETYAGGLAMLAVFSVFWRYWRQPREPYRGWRALVIALTMLVPVVGWALGAWLAGAGRRLRYGYQLAIVGFWLGFLVMAIVWLAGPTDGFGGMVVGLILLALLWGWIGGRVLMPTYQNTLAFPSAPGYPAGGLPPAGPVLVQTGPEAALGQASAAGRPVYDAPLARGGSDRKAEQAASPGKDGPFRVTRPGDLPTFAQVGGMEPLKRELDQTLGLMLAYATEAEQYRIEFNGILLHGKPGVGKTFIARAAAGEYGMSFVQVTTGDLVSPYVGQAARNVEAAFAAAVANLPCLLFFDEFDSVASRRSDQPSEESRRVVNQLLTSLERFRGVGELVVMAATNHLDQLDPAAIRPGRFDRHVRVDLPDAPAREAILGVLLEGRPTGEVALAELVRKTEGMTPATLEAIVETAAMSALQQTVETGQPVPISTAHLNAALEARGGKDRPHLAGHDWDDVILPDPVKAELQQVQRLVEDPDLAARYGVEPPSGLLLTGPPGTGKTTLARVLAAQTRCSFYVVSPADVTSKWVGESENRIQRLFERARANAPSIVFLDEIDALAGRRGELGTSGVDTAILTQLLTQLDGLEERGRVFVIGATNRPETVDPALLRPGRLSRVLEVPLPDAPGRRRLLDLFTANMQLRDVDLAGLADQTEGWSGADLEGLCQQAAVHAMMTAGAEEHPEVDASDFGHALTTLRDSRNRLDSARAATPSLNDHLDALQRPSRKES